ncbi:MAG TPA: GFA family protein [Steroidobacteraceae bacterium]|nr:GFA family protein [Steroidobacteraceae bacterium]
MLSGSCSCGAVKFRLIAAPMFVHCCHCTDCQRQTGSAFVLNALIEADRVELLQGATRGYPQPTDSGRPHIIQRCADCGTALWSNYGGREQVRFVRIGTLDEARTLPPDVHIYTRSKQPWVTLPGDRAGAAGASSGEVGTGSPSDGATTKKPAEVFEAYYEIAKLWPPESLARRKALFG